MWQVGELVLPPPLGEGVAQLPACIAGEAGGEAELMFGPPLQGSITEAEAWLVGATQRSRIVHAHTIVAYLELHGNHCAKYHGP